MDRPCDKTTLCEMVGKHTCQLYFIDLSHSSKLETLNLVLLKIHGWSSTFKMSFKVLLVCMWGTFDTWKIPIDNH